jgi:hypothetical protein
MRCPVKADTSHVHSRHEKAMAITPSNPAPEAASPVVVSQAPPGAAPVAVPIAAPIPPAPASPVAGLLASRAREFWVAVGAVAFIVVGVLGSWATVLGALSVSGLDTSDGKFLVVMAAGAAWCLFRYAKHARRRNLVIAAIIGVVTCGLAIWEIVDFGGTELVSVGWGLYVDAIAAGVLVGACAKLWRAGSYKDAKAEAAAAKAQRPWYKMKRWWAAGLLLFAIIGVAGSGISSDDSQPTVSHNTTQAAQSGQPAAEEGPTFENGVLTTPDLKIQITRSKVINAGQEGNEYGEKPVIAFWYKTTNLSGAKVDPTDFLFNFDAYQDNNPNAENELELGSSPDDRFLDSKHETIKKGGTVENAVAYELDDLVTPVNLVATEGLDEVIGKATYKLR